MRIKILAFPNLYLIIIILIGISLRFYNLNWDQNYTFHPDEENIARAANRIRFFDQLNPHFFAYGGIYVYLERAGFDLISAITKNNIGTDIISSFIMVGRFLSAFFSSLSLICIYFLIKEIFNKRVALLGVFLLAFNVASIQAAHFAVTESALILQVIVITYVSFKLLKHPKIITYILGGVLFGLALAVKSSAVSFILPIIITHIIILTKQFKSFIALNIKFFIFLISSLIIFFIFSPYSFLDWPNFYKSMSFESSVVTGSKKVTYTLQFTNTTPYFYQIKNLFWLMGPIALISILGFSKILADFFRKRDNKLLVLLCFPMVYFLIIGSWHAKFIRYTLPLIPFFIIAASFLLLNIKNKFNKAGLFIVIFFLSATLFWALSFFTIYTREDTRISASKWIYQNIPKRSSILTEYHDSVLPIEIPAFRNNIYDIKFIDSFNSNDPAYYAKNLASSDFIILSSRRIYKNIENLSRTYPLANKYYVSNKYYQLLFSDKLGYQKTAEFQSYPSLFGFIINDDNSEESFQVLDHPKIQIFKNTYQFNENDYINLLKNPMY